MSPRLCMILFANRKSSNQFFWEQGEKILSPFPLWIYISFVTRLFLHGENYYFRTTSWNIPVHFKKQLSCWPQCKHDHINVIYQIKILLHSFLSSVYVSKRMVKLWCIHKMKYYLARKRNELLIRANNMDESPKKK